jgi:hypothetical protein
VREQGYGTAWLLKSPDAAYTLMASEYFGQTFVELGGTVVVGRSYTMTSPTSRPSSSPSKRSALSPTPS